MRLSRRGGMLGAHGVKWEKHACTRYPDGQTYYTEGPWTLDYETTGSFVSGYSSYSFSGSTGEFSPSGTYQTSVTSGTVFNTMSQSVERLSISGQAIAAHLKTAVKHTVDTYAVGERLGTVYAPEGTYPDSRRGYTYVCVLTNGYTVMRDANFNYYAYKEAE